MEKLLRSMRLRREQSSSKPLIWEAKHYPKLFAFGMFRIAGTRILISWVSSATEKEYTHLENAVRLLVVEARLLALGRGCDAYFGRELA